MKRVCLLFVVCLASLWAAPALADEEFARREGEARFREGIALHDAGRDDESLTKFVQAYAALRRPNVLYNLARAEHLTHRDVEALRHYRQYLREDPSPEDRAVIEQYVRELDGRTGHLRVHAPIGAKITLDGAPALEWSEALDVAPGAHTVVASFGPHSKSVTATARPGQTEAVTFAFETREHPAPGVRVATHWPPPTVSIVLGAVGIASLATSAAFALDAKSKSDDLGSASQMNACANQEMATASCVARQDLIDARKRSETVAVATGVAGGVALMAGVAFWIAAPRVAERVEKTGVVPWVGPGGAGAAWNVRF